MKLVIEGCPIAKSRHRCGCKGRTPIAYDPQVGMMKAISYEIERQIKRAFKSKDKQIVMEASELAQVESFDVTFTFLFPTPDRLTYAQKNAKLWGFETFNTKPDFDNLEKLYADCLTKAFWDDDAQVVANNSKKFYSENPRTEITIMAKKGIKLHPNAEAAMKSISPSELREFLTDVREFWSFPVERVDEILPESANETKERDLTTVAHLLIEFSRKHHNVVKRLSKCESIPIEGDAFTQEVLKFY